MALSMKDALVAASVASPGPWAAQPQQQQSLNGMFDRMRYEVYKYTCEHLDKSDAINFPFTEDTVYIVWSCKTLQNWKALISTSLSDGMYYECTYDGDKGCMYFDAYKKFDHRQIKL